VYLPKSQNSSNDTDCLASSRNINIGKITRSWLYLYTYTLQYVPYIGIMYNKERKKKIWNWKQGIFVCIMYAYIRILHSLHEKKNCRNTKADIQLQSPEPELVGLTMKTEKVLSWYYYVWDLLPGRKNGEDEKYAFSK